MVRVTRKQKPQKKRTAARAKRVLKELQQESAEQYAARLAKKYEIAYIDLNLVPIYADDVRILDEETTQNQNAIVFHKSGKKVRIATTDPATERLPVFLRELEEKYGWQIVLYCVSPASFAKALLQYKNTTLKDYVDSLRLSLSDKDLELFEKNITILSKLEHRIEEMDTTEIISTIMSGAVKMDASDVHLEPQETKIRLRYRIDGVLQDIAYLPEKTHRLLLSRIKVMGGMKINVRRVAQDGRFSITIDDREMDVRVSIIPEKDGESIVMRLLDQASVITDMADLGLRGAAYEEIQKHMVDSNGMILTTGPTGSGKTTTLYSIINRINAPETKIVTIEDPVEYHIKGITQTQVAKKDGYSFAKGLRALVRQDPDVVLVGEIRDDETADIAINAALTGHLVLSTLHTNNAAATIPRLFELGVKPTLIPPAINAFVAQRLVRKLCAHCKEEYVPAEESVLAIKKILALIPARSGVTVPKDIPHLYRTKGCAECRGTGYRGRMGIFEVLTMNEKIENLVIEMAGETEIMKTAMENGMLTMTQDGVLKALEGETTMEEVWRVTAEKGFLEEMYEDLVDQSLSRAIVLKDTHAAAAQKSAVSFEKMATAIAKTKSDNIVPFLLSLALHLHAADVHIEPQEKEVLLRLRIDGVLQTIGTIPLTEYPPLLGKIKLLSGIKTQARQGVQDSRFRIELPNDEKVDVRVSLILGGFGETVVLRLLNTAVVDLNIETLGIREQNLKKILHETQKPYGVFLNTGPTGSGKTTTLYSLLRVLNTGSSKIITVEDPIEYQLDGILQTQVDKEQGYTFATALKSLLRQDPDIMMVGEIRDEETAAVGLQAALTGHLILSTLHTNDAAGAVQRLTNLGTRPNDIITGVNAMMAQRLVRKLCDCKKKVALSGDMKERMKNIVGTISKESGVPTPKLTHVFEPAGCKQCNGIGFKGRTVISEVLSIDDDIQKLIAQGALASEIKDKAIENGMLTMLQDGALKALEGETTLDDVERVTSA